MKSILTSEEKKLLRTNCRYLNSHGMEEGLVEIDVDYSIDEDTFDSQNLSNYSNNYSTEILDGVKQILQKMFDYCLNENLFKEDFDVDVNYQRIEFLIDCSKSEISVSQYYSYYESSDSEGVTYDDEEEVMPILDALKNAYVENKIKLPKIVEIAYNGSGDSGYIEDYTGDNVGVPPAVEDFGYRALEDHFGGWEINEGSQGTFYFNMSENTIELIHTSNFEENSYDTIFEEKFGI